jgi:hypothetical protein
LWFGALESSAGDLLPCVPDAQVLVADAFGLRDDRNVDLPRLGVVTRNAKQLAILQAIIAADRVRDDMIEMTARECEIDATSIAVREQPFAPFFRALEGVTLYGLAKFSPHSQPHLLPETMLESCSDALLGEPSLIFVI